METKVFFEAVPPVDLEPTGRAVEWLACGLLAAGGDVCRAVQEYVGVGGEECLKRELTDALGGVWTRLAQALNVFRLCPDSDSSPHLLENLPRGAWEVEAGCSSVAAQMLYMRGDLFGEDGPPVPGSPRASAVDAGLRSLERGVKPLVVGLDRMAARIGYTRAELLEVAAKQRFWWCLPLECEGCGTPSSDLEARVTVVGIEEGFFSPLCEACEEIAPMVYDYSVSYPEWGWADEAFENWARKWPGDERAVALLLRVQRNHARRQEQASSPGAGDRQ